MDEARGLLVRLRHSEAGRMYNNRTKASAA
jgi:hypothetical protein